MICDELDWGSSQINTTWLFITKWPIQRNLDLWWTWLRFITNHPVPQAQVWKESLKNWSKVLKTVWFCDEPQSSSSQTEVVPPILICDEQQLHSSEIQVLGHFRFLRSLAMGSTEIESFVMSVMPQEILDQRRFKCLLSSCTSWGHVWADDCNLSRWQ